MDTISKYYEKGQYLKCANLLADFPSDSLFDKCLVENNVLVTRFQISFVQKDNLLRKSVFDDLFRLQASLLALPHEKEYNLLLLCCASNAIYLLLNDQCTEENSGKAVQIGNGAFEKIICNYQLFYYQEKNSIDDKLVGLVHELLQCKKLNSNELSLLLYSCLLICLIKHDLKYVELVKNILEILEKSMKDETPSLNHICIFLLSPLEMSLQSSCCSAICDFSRLFLSMFYCANSSWSEALAIMDASTYLDGSCAKNSQWSEIWGIFQIYANLHSINSSNEEEIEEHCYESNSYLYFARCLINAAKFALKKKPLIALKYLNFAGAGKLARTQACSIVMAFAATQFKVLEQSNFEIEALKIAEESLLKSPALQCSIHTEICGFLLKQMKLFSLPEVSVLRYQLARIFLQNQRYQEAAEEYEKLSEASFQHQWAPFATVFKFISPTITIVLHERILSLVLSNNYQKALDAIDSSIDEDLFTLYLHAQICTHLKQYKKAIQLINSSILKLNSTTFPVSETKDVIRSKFCFKLSQLLYEIGNIKDAHHQLKLSFQYGISMNCEMLEFYQTFTRKLGAPKEIPLPSDPQQEKMIAHILEHSNDLTLNYVIRDSCTQSSLP